MKIKISQEAKKWFLVLFWFVCLFSTGWVFYTYALPENENGIRGMIAGIALPVIIFVWLPMFTALLAATFASTKIGGNIAEQQVSREIEQVKHGLYH